MAMFGGAIALSAFLLFWIEPLIGQVVLPVFGGTPAVWATVLVFFQGAVLIGYLYGHLSVTRLGLRRGAVVHLVVAVAAMAWLVLMPVRQAELRTADLPEALDVLRILIVAVGPPVILLTSTTPLLSAWYAATRAPRAGVGGDGDPYGLYAVSNAASLAALLAYPLVIGPLVGLSRQGVLWSIAFGALCVVLAVTAMTSRRRSRPPMEIPLPPVEVETPAPVAFVATGGGGSSVGDGADPAIGWARRLRWVLLAAVPSGLLAAVTNFIAADLIAAPLLWIGPLAVYLGSFIVAFSARGRRLVPFAIALAPAVITLLWTPIGSAGGWPILPLIVLEWGGLAIVATALHGRLAGDRPAPARLTEFYLVQSAGGVTGGALVAIVAPLAFDGVWEYPLLLVAALAALAVTGPRRPPTDRARDRRSEPALDREIGETTPRGLDRARRPILDLRPFFSGAGARVVPYAVAATAVAAIMAVGGSIATQAAIRWFLVGGLVLLVGSPPRFLAVSTAVVLTLATFVLPGPALLRDRSFFGVTEVIRSVDGAWIQLMNGTTLHGVQATDPLAATQPTFYYARSGPLGDILETVDERRPEADVAITGLGSGGIAAYTEPGYSLTFFEIDPVVVRVATDARYFTYLADAPVAARIVLGDARLSLRDEPDASFDLLILDAFSSDAVPAHLLTVEALLDDRRVLRPDGLLAIHVSNRYYDLAPAIGAAADRLGMVVLERRYAPTPEDEAAEGASPSIWVVASADPGTIERFRAMGWVETSHDGIDPITDDHPDVLRFLHLGR
ncbi:MAG: fused MFS/spermidine synthase [Chloroflexi bacterium]|nr:fused MFS/spermidine synthase [Chloroflexota bacterium]